MNHMDYAPYLIPVGLVLFFMFIVWPLKALIKHLIPDGKIKNILFKEY